MDSFFWKCQMCNVSGHCESTLAEHQKHCPGLVDEPKVRKCCSPFSDAHYNALRETANAICKAIQSDCWKSNTFAGRKVLTEQLGVIVETLAAFDCK